MKWFFLAIFCLLTIIFLTEYRVVGQAVYGDGRYYWGITRSLYFSQNIDVSDEMAHFYDPRSNNSDLFFGHVPAFADKTRRVTGGFSLGMVPFWLPFYFLADVLVVSLRALGIHIVRNGYSDIYQIVVGLGNILYVILGLVMLGETLRSWYSKKVTLLSLTLVLFGTNLLYYSSLDTINSHPLSFFLVSSLVWLLFRFQKTRKILFLVGMGIVCGFLAGNRRQDVFFLIIPFLQIIFNTISLHNKILQPKNLWKLIQQGALLLLGVFLGYLPQFLLISFGQGHLALYARTERAFSFPTHLLDIIFNEKLGIMFYMPVFLLGIFGLIMLLRKRKVEAGIFLVVIAVQLTLLSSWGGWSQASYSMRYLIGCWPLLVFGIAEVIQHLLKRFSLVFVIVCIGIFILHQFIMISSFKLFLQDPTYVGTELSRSGQLKMQIIERIGNLFPR